MPPGAGEDLLDHLFGDAAVAEKVRADFRRGLRAGVATTPTLFVDGVRHGGRPSPELWAALGGA